MALLEMNPYLTSSCGFPNVENIMAAIVFINWFQSIELYTVKRGQEATENIRGLTRGSPSLSKRPKSSTIYYQCLVIDKHSLYASIESYHLNISK